MSEEIKEKEQHEKDLKEGKNLFVAILTFMVILYIVKKVLGFFH